MKLIKKFKGDIKHECVELENYVAEMKRSNKSSTVELERKDDSNVFKK